MKLFLLVLWMVSFTSCHSLKHAISPYTQGPIVDIPEVAWINNIFPMSLTWEMWIRNDNHLSRFCI